MTWLAEPVEFEFMRQALAITAPIAAAAGALSCLLVLKGWSLMGDAISHAVLPGIVLAHVVGAPLVQHAHHHVKAAPLDAQKRLGRQFHVVEGQRAHLARALAHLDFLGAARDPVRVQVDDEDGHAATPGLGVRPREDEPDIGDRRVVDPDLAAVEHPSVPVARGGGPDARHVRPGLGFRDAIGDPLPRRQDVTQPPRALRVVAMGHEKGADQFDEAALIRHRGVSARQLLHHDRVGDRIEAGAAHGLGDADPEQAQLGHPVVDFGWEAGFAIQLLGQRADRVFRELPGHVADLRVFSGQIHGFIL